MMKLGVYALPLSPSEVATVVRTTPIPDATGQIGFSVRGEYYEIWCTRRAVGPFLKHLREQIGQELAA